MKKILIFCLVFMMWVGVAWAEVSINKGTIAELESLPHIGHVKAMAIVEYRDSNGPFTSIDDLIKVKGIGEKTLTKIKDQLQL